MRRGFIAAFVLMSFTTATALPQQDVARRRAPFTTRAAPSCQDVRVPATELATSVITETTTNAEGLYAPEKTTPEKRSRQ
jgi:hypothetical protein